MHDEFLAKRHAGFNTPSAIVLELIRRATGQTPINHKKVAHGFENEVYLVATSNSEFIVRIRHFGEVDFTQESWAMQQCKSVGVPTAEVLLVDNLQVEKQNLEAMVCTKLPGRSLEELQAHLTKQQIEDVLQQASKLLGRIHSISTEGFYQLHNGRWDFASWNEFMDWIIKGREQEKEQLIQGGFSSGDVEHMLLLLAYYQQHYPVSQSILCHGDYLPKHIFVDDNLNISGIIDFGRSVGASPIHDFAFLDFEDEGSWLLATLMKAYPNQDLFDDDFANRLDLHKLGVQMAHLAYHVRFENSAGIHLVANKLMQTHEKLKQICQI